MRGGELVGLDEAALRVEVRECAAELESYLEGTRAGVAELEPYYREMYRRSLEHPIAMSRWVGGPR